MPPYSHYLVGPDQTTAADLPFGNNPFLIFFFYATVITPGQEESVSVTKRTALGVAVRQPL